MRYLAILEKLPPLSRAALGTDYYGKTIPEPLAMRLLDTYVQNGGNVIDTAHVYSDYLPGEKHMSEKVIGRWLAGSGAGSGAVICTKGGFPEIGDMHASRITEKQIGEDLAGSLDCLGVGKVGIYWLHRDDPSVSAGEIAEWMNRFYREGAFTYWGVSNWSSARIEEAVDYCAANGLEPPVCSQIKWSLAIPVPGSAGDDTLREMNESEYRWYLRSGMPVFAYSSQAKGFFPKLLKSGGAKPAGKAGDRYFSEENLRRFDVLRRVSEETGLTVAQLSAAWMTRPGTVPVIPILGAASAEQLAESLSGAAAELDPEIIAKHDLFRRDRI